MALKFSANVGFLWDHLPLPERISAASAAGFEAVECHFPYEYPAEEIDATLLACNMPMVGINTLLGPAGESSFGVCAAVGKESLARQFIDQAIAYAVNIRASYVNVVAGANSNGVQTSETVFRGNLRYACEQAAMHNLMIVIEPLNPRAVANYHVQTVEQGVATIKAVAHDNLKLMFDVFHTQIVQGDLQNLLCNHIEFIGHVQISAVHDRGEPDVGEVNYPYVLQILEKAGYTGYIGAEYKPRGDTVEAGLSWLAQFRHSM